MASLTWWTWVWIDSGSWWWTGRPGVLRFMGLQRVGHDWATELNWNTIVPSNPIWRNLGINRMLYLFFFLIWPCCEACGILVSRPGIEPLVSALEAWSPNHWIAREVPGCCILIRGRTHEFLKQFTGRRQIRRETDHLDPGSPNDLL